MNPIEKFPELNKLSQNDKLRLAYALLLNVSDNWDEEKVVVYGSNLSFDELAHEVGTVELSN